MIVPEIHADYAFEYKLGFEAGVEANATCPIKNSMVDPLLRREAWWAGWKARRKALGKPQMRPMRVGRVIAHKAMQVAS